MDTTQLIREVWPEWQIVDKIGEGSYGTVYRARRQDASRFSESAIKVARVPHDPGEHQALRLEGMNDEEIRTYLLGVVRDLTAEVRLMVSVQTCPNIVGVEDFRVIERKAEMTWYILIRMPLLTPLSARQERSALSEEEIIRLGLDMCTALSVCREHNIVHRDIKPENMFVDRQGRFVLGDFGVARSLNRLTTRMTRVGTYNYMAPEMFNDTMGKVGIDDASRMDIYSLGMVMYQLANRGRLPLCGDDSDMTPRRRQEALTRRMRGETLPPPSNASDGLARIIMKACAYNPSARWPSAQAMGQALAQLAGIQPMAGGAGSAEKTAEPFQTQPQDAEGGTRKLLIAAVAMILVGALTLGIALISRSHRRSDEPAAAVVEETPTPSPIPTDAPTSTPTPTPTDTPTPSPSPTPTDTPTPSPTPTDTPTPSPTPTAIPTQAPETDITFADPTVEAAIRSALGIPSGPLTQAQLASVTDLTLEDVDSLSDLSDVARLTGLSSLSIYGCGVSDLSPLAGLSSLKWLTLHDCLISDLSPLAGLTQLNWLDLGSNLVSDVSPLAGLTQLETLFLTNNRISDISPLAGLSGLDSLYLADNPISDLSPLAGLSRLDSLYLASNGLTDLSPLAGLQRLTNLSVFDNSISDLSPLAGLTGLQLLDLSFNQISDISPLAGLTQLQWLDLAFNQISDVSPLTGLSQLTYLDIAGNDGITNIQSLSHLNLEDYYGPDRSPATTEPDATEQDAPSEASDVSEWEVEAPDSELPAEAEPGSPEADALSDDFAELKKGDSGDGVVTLQLLLVRHNYLNDKADGVYGGKTEAAVKRVQADADLEQTGVCDVSTMAYLLLNSAPFEATKDNDLLFYGLTMFDDILCIHLKNMGRNPVASAELALYQCNQSKGSLGDFFNRRNSRSHSYWTVHQWSGGPLESGEDTIVYLDLTEGTTYGNSDGTSDAVTYFSDGKYARITLNKFTTGAGKTVSANQTLYCEFR